MFGLIPVVGPLLAVVFGLGGVAALFSGIASPFNALAGIALLALAF